MGKEILVGAHVSIAKDISFAFKRGESIGCTAIQIFVKSSRSWFDKPLKDQDIEKFKREAKSSSIKYVNAHAAYLINIGSNKEDIEKKSTSSLLHELLRCEQLDIPYLVLHPGSHLCAGEKKCLEQISKNLDIVLNKTSGNTHILLETMAGQGTNVGYTFEHLDTIRTLSDYKKKIGICLDTCHIFAAGYDISTEKSFLSTLKTFDNILGFSNLKIIHLNGSQYKLGTRVDRHCSIEEGQIPLLTFKLIINDKRLINIPKILETPSDPEMNLWAKEITFLKKLAQT
jgi:deoxyribonuclease-4